MSGEMGQEKYMICYIILCYVFKFNVLGCTFYTYTTYPFYLVTFKRVLQLATANQKKMVRINGKFKGISQKKLKAKIFPSRRNSPGRR